MGRVQRRREEERGREDEHPQFLRPLSLSVPWSICWWSPWCISDWTTVIQCCWLVFRPIYSGSTGDLSPGRPRPRHWCFRQLHWLRIPLQGRRDDIQSSAWHRTVIPRTTHPCHWWPPGGVICHVHRAFSAIVPHPNSLPDDVAWCLCLSFAFIFFILHNVLFYCEHGGVDPVGLKSNP